MIKRAKARAGLRSLPRNAVLPRRKLRRELWWARYIIVRMGGRAVGLWAAARLLGQVSLSRSVWTLLAAVLLLELMNRIVRLPGKLTARPGFAAPLLIGVFAWTMLELWIVDFYLGGFEIDGFWAYAKAALIFLTIGTVLSKIFDPDDADARFLPFQLAHEVRARSGK
jgi:uncharacterized membrane protein YvlD (DUF360 family)